MYCVDSNLDTIHGLIDLRIFNLFGKPYKKILMFTVKYGKFTIVGEKIFFIGEKVHKKVQILTIDHCRF